METLEKLSDELKAWQNSKGLPNECALEQMNGILVDDSERKWLKAFCEKWEKAQKI